MTTPYGGVEIGGTKINCIAAAGPEEILAERRIPTTDAAEGLAQAVAFFREHPVAAIGVGCFGPMVLDPESPSYGQLRTCSKPGWSHADLLAPFAPLDVPLALETDVGVALLGEAVWGATADCRSSVYLTVGTGIGGAAMVAGRMLHGRMHPEMGHIPVARQSGDDFPGCCPFHGDCLQGLASGKAMQQRWDCRADELPADHPGLELEAAYLARALLMYHYTLSPERILLGGGVMVDQSGLFPRIRERFLAELAGYQPPEIPLDDFIRPPGLGHRAGPLGAVRLAEFACGGR